MKKINFKKLGGLVPAIIQDRMTRQVLMLGYMNAEAWRRTLATRQVTFWSRSKKRLWTKGEESGNYLKFISVKIDCDQDALLIEAEPMGNTCHQGRYSCFGEKEAGIYFLSQLENIIEARKNQEGKDSYVRSLLDQGVDRMAQKVGEEAVEVVVAAKNDEKQELVNEVADLLFHLLVLLRAKGVRLEEVAGELERRGYLKKF